MIYRSGQLGGMLLVILVTSGCVQIPSHSASRELLVPNTRVPGESAEWLGLTWLSDGRLVSGLFPNPDLDQRLDPDYVLMSIDPATGARARLDVPIPAEGTCRLRRVFDPNVLSDGRLGYTSECLGATVLQDIESHRALDLASGEATELAALNYQTSGDLTWNPTFTRAVISNSSSICAGMAWYFADAIYPMPVTIREGGSEFSLADWYPGSTGESCTPTGRAYATDWSKDGTQVAFLASAASVGRDGFARLDAPWTLYFLDVEQSTARLIVANLYDPLTARWSPDGAWVAYATRAEAHGDAIWLYSMEDATSYLIFRGAATGLSWSADGRQIAVAVSRFDATASPIDYSDDLVILEVSAITDTSGATSGP